MEYPETVEVTTGENPVGSVIWLHGLGADGHDFEPIVPELRLPAELPLRFVFPHAPVRPVTINGGATMRAWYDILSLDAEGRADAAGVRESTALLEALIEREQERGVAANRIVVAGFSQGGAIAINAILHAPQKLAGLMALSTYIALPGELATSDGNRDLPVFMAHGSFDPMLPMQWGKASAEQLSALVLWHASQQYCGICGSTSNPEAGGNARRCNNSDCGRQIFPRTDPAVIVLVTHEERCLLGRQAGWPEHRYSTVAGFVEPGESLEDAVRREVFEETNIRVSTVSYHSSQPWPFPSALMLGFIAAASTTDIVLNDGELEDAQWFTREQLLSDFPKLPFRISIARRLVDHWITLGKID